MLLQLFWDPPQASLIVSPFSPYIPWLSGMLGKFEQASPGPLLLAQFPPIKGLDFHASGFGHLTYRLFIVFHKRLI